MVKKQQHKLGLLPILAFIFAQDSSPGYTAKTETNAQIETPKEELITTTCGLVPLDSIASTLFTQQKVYPYLYSNTSHERGGIIRRQNNCLELIELDDPSKEDLFRLQKIAQSNNPEVFGQLAQYTARKLNTIQQAGADETLIRYFRSLTETFTKASINYMGIYSNDPELFNQLSSGPITQQELDSFDWFTKGHKLGMNYEQIRTKNPEKATQAQAYLIKSTFIDAEATIQTLLRSEYNFQKEIFKREDVVAYWHTHTDDASPYSSPDVIFSKQHGPLFTVYPTTEGYLHIYLNRNGHFTDVTQR
ncbi:MAG: hypothetical protein WC254_04180 [Candidatus Woesearchaeota archaeon]|jgi:hypothetical protein